MEGPILGPHWMAWQAWIPISFKCVPKLLQHGSWKELVEIWEVGKLGEDHMWEKDGCFFFTLLQGFWVQASDRDLQRFRDTHILHKSCEEVPVHISRVLAMTPHLCYVINFWMGATI